MTLKFEVAPSISPDSAHRLRKRVLCKERRPSNVIREIKFAFRFDLRHARQILTSMIAAPVPRPLGLQAADH